MEPPETATLLTATCEPPEAAVFVSVTTPVPVMFRTPLGSVIVSGLGEIDMVARVATPVPVNVSGVGVTVAPV